MTPDAPVPGADAPDGERHGYPTSLDARPETQRRLRILACLGGHELARLMATDEPDRENQRGPTTTPEPLALPQPPQVEGQANRGGRVKMEICIHEAGHALARWYVGLPFEQVHTFPALGSAAAVTGFDFIPRRQEWLALAAAGDPTALVRGRALTELEMFCTYAGPFAQARQRHWCTVRQRSWRCDVQSILFGGGGEGDWSLVESNAADWPEEGIAMAARACRLTAAFVRSDAAWRAIRAVARRLSVARGLTWDEVSAIASGHFGRPAPALEDWLPKWPPLASAVRGGYLPPAGLA